MTLPLPSDGPLLGRFAIEREIGRGAVGVVYRALDLSTDSPVALKILASEAGVAPEDEERLRRNVRGIAEDEPELGPERP